MPRLLIDDRFRILDLYARTIVADNLSVDEVHAKLEEILADHTNTDPAVGIDRFWARTRVQSESSSQGSSGFYTWYRILPVNPNDADANTQLLAAALRRRWPAAAFTVMPTGTGSVSIRWIDGPDHAAVDDYCLHVEGPDGPFESVEFTRILTLRAWQAIAALVEAWLPVTVPCTETGDIDWHAAETVELDPAVSVAGHRVCRRPRLISLTLGEVLRHLPDACDLSAVHDASIQPAHSEEPDAEQS
ncbi:hypothetical protein ACWF9G_27190 [Nocardia sp. NPDC055029]